MEIFPIIVIIFLLLIPTHSFCVRSQHDFPSCLILYSSLHGLINLGKWKLTFIKF
jgi:hypothetical protein